MINEAYGSSRIYRLPRRGVFGGVCAGIAAHYDWNLRLIRALAVAATLFALGPFGLLAYGIAWYVLEPAYDSRPFEPGAGRYNRRGRRRYRWRHASSYDDDLYDDEPRRADPAGAGSGFSTADLQARFDRLDARLRNMEECVTSKEFELHQEFRKLGS